MELGFVGLGRMGGNMVGRLVGGGHRVVGYDRAATAVATIEAAGARSVRSLADLVRALAPPRAVWVMIPAGEPTAATIRELGELLQAGDIVIDDGNSHFKDDRARAAELRGHSIDYVDAGVSGGIWGAEYGYCLMVGGDAAVVTRLAPLFATLAPPDGWLHVGPVGSGHYAKMIHNGIEYGLMQAYAEGFELMSASEFGLDVAAVARLWTHASVVRSWLLELTAATLADDPQLAGFKPWVEDSGEGRWTVEDAVEKAVPAPVITAALFARFRSRRENSFADRLLAALRQRFGGHAAHR